LLKTCSPATASAAAAAPAEADAATTPSRRLTRVFTGVLLDREPTGALLNSE
jgi:hypothetical protein